MCGIIPMSVVDSRQARQRGGCCAERHGIDVCVFRQVDKTGDAVTAENFFEIGRSSQVVRQDSGCGSSEFHKTLSVANPFPLLSVSTTPTQDPKNGQTLPKQELHVCPCGRIQRREPFAFGCHHKRQFFSIADCTLGMTLCHSRRQRSVIIVSRIVSAQC